MFVHADVFNGQFFRLLFEAGAGDEGFRGGGQFAEAVDEFGGEVLQFVFGFCLRQALVEDEALLRVVDVVVGQKRRHAQFDGAARRVKVGGFAVFQRGDAALQQVEVVADADLLDLSALFVAKDFARAADFEVLARQQEARAEAVQGGEGFEAPLRVFAEGVPVGGDEVGIRLVVAAADSAAQLVQLRQAEFVGAVDDDGVGVGDVDAAFDDGGGDEDVVVAVLEVLHQVFEFALAHLSVANGDALFWQGVLQQAGDALDAVDVVVQDVGLSATAVFALAGVADGFHVPFGEDGLDVLSSCRWGGDDADVTQAAQGEVQGARDGGGGQGEEVGVASEAFEFFFVAHTEALFFVDDDEAEVFELDVFL